MEFTLFKPTKKQTGGAVKFNVHKTGKFSFMKAAKQIAPMGESRVFGWEDELAINVKMGLNDLGSFLAVIYGKEQTVKLFHRTDNDNKIIELSHIPERRGYSLKISHKCQGNTEANSVFIGINYPEAMILKVYIENTIREMLESAVWAND